MSRRGAGTLERSHLDSRANLMQLDAVARSHGGLGARRSGAWDSRELRSVHSPVL